MAQKLLGITLPIERGNTGYFAQTTDIPTQVKSNLINLLLTNVGERIMLPLFGCNLRQYLFQPMTDSVTNNINGTITLALKQWLPYVTITNLNIAQEQDYHKVTISLSYAIAVTPTSFDSVSIVFSQ